MGNDREKPMSDAEAMALGLAAEAGEPGSEQDLLRLAGRMRKRIAENPDHPTSRLMAEQLRTLDKVLPIGRAARRRD